jgi:hypothetical protein
MEKKSAFKILLMLSFFLISGCTKLGIQTGAPSRIEKTKTVPLEIITCYPVYDESQVVSDLKIAIEFNKALPSSYTDKANSLLSINKIEFSDQKRSDITVQKPSKRTRVPITFEVIGNSLMIIFPQKTNLKDHFGHYQLQLKELPDIGSIVYQFNFIVPLPPSFEVMSGPFSQSLSNIEDNG